MRIALLGAGGKMGVRLATNLKDTDFAVDHVEISEEGRRRLKDAVGVDCVETGQAVSGADAVVLAVPDRAIGAVAHDIIDKVRPGTALLVLDAAAPHAGKMPKRDDVTYFVTHPCHPSIFNYEDTQEKQNDFFGGVAAKQHIVCALMQGPEEDYARCEAVARAIYAPVDRAHRCTVEQIAILEPALSETVGATLCMALREAADRAVAEGVPRQAAMDFILGHLNIELAIAFEVFPEGKFSDGALLAIEQAKPVIFKDGWLDRVFDPQAIKKSVDDICDPPPTA
ncbi:phosphogluconate dehydrogenase C-terminal domain-containing protein [Bauldia sp.]|uniref:phosphogluconate dehydrogenase C-terminal domain-containing protein n=1 Tax=Bauldia sp. TaxID=2575872 RepID=UPI003BA94CB8